MPMIEARKRDARKYEEFENRMCRIGRIIDCVLNVLAIPLRMLWFRLPCTFDHPPLQVLGAAVS